MYFKCIVTPDYKFEPPIALYFACLYSTANKTILEVLWNIRKFEKKLLNNNLPVSVAHVWTIQHCHHTHWNVPLFLNKNMLCFCTSLRKKHIFYLVDVPTEFRLCHSFLLLLNAVYNKDLRKSDAISMKHQWQKLGKKKTFPLGKKEIMFFLCITSQKPMMLFIRR